MKTNRDLCGISEVAEHFRVSVSTVRTWVRNGKIPHLKAGNIYRFDLAEVEACLTRLAKAEKGEKFEKRVISPWLFATGLVYRANPEMRAEIKGVLEERLSNRQRAIVCLGSGIPIFLTNDDLIEVFQLQPKEIEEVRQACDALSHPARMPFPLRKVIEEKFTELKKKKFSDP